MNKPEGLVYLENIVDPEISNKILDNYKFEQVGNTQKLHCRQWLQFGYEYSPYLDKLTETQPIPDFLEEILKQSKNALSEFCPNIKSNNYQNCIVNLYPQNTGIYHHIDDLMFDDHILGVTLGSNRNLTFRYQGDFEKEFILPTKVGSIYLMSGPARYTYTHAMTTQPNPQPVLSITFRQIA